MDAKEYISRMGYRDDSPYRNSPYLDIHTPNGIIDMSYTGMPLFANGQYLPPYSGQHNMGTQNVREVPVAQSGGELWWREMKDCAGLSGQALIACKASNNYKRIEGEKKEAEFDSFLKANPNWKPSENIKYPDIGLETHPFDAPGKLSDWFGNVSDAGGFGEVWSDEADTQRRFDKDLEAYRLSKKQNAEVLRKHERVGNLEELVKRGAEEASLQSTREIAEGQRASTFHQRPEFNEWRKYMEDSPTYNLQYGDSLYEQAKSNAVSNVIAEGPPFSMKPYEEEEANWSKGMSGQPYMTELGTTYPSPTRVQQYGNLGDKNLWNYYKENLPTDVYNPMRQQFEDATSSEYWKEVKDQQRQSRETEEEIRGDSWGQFWDTWMAPATYGRSNLPIEDEYLARQMDPDYGGISGLDAASWFIPYNIPAHAAGLYHGLGATKRAVGDVATEAASTVGWGEPSREMTLLDPIGAGLTGMIGRGLYKGAKSYLPNKGEIVQRPIPEVFGQKIFPENQMTGQGLGDRGIVWSDQWNWNNPGGMGKPGQILHPKQTSAWDLTEYNPFYKPLEYSAEAGWTPKHHAWRGAKVELNESPQLPSATRTGPRKNQMRPSDKLYGQEAIDATRPWIAGSQGTAKPGDVYPDAPEQPNPYRNYESYDPTTGQPIRSAPSVSEEILSLHDQGIWNIGPQAKLWETDSHFPENKISKWVFEGGLQDGIPERLHYLQNLTSRLNTYKKIGEESREEELNRLREFGDDGLNETGKISSYPSDLWVLNPYPTTRREISIEGMDATSNMYDSHHFAIGLHQIFEDLIKYYDEYVSEQQYTEWNQNDLTNDPDYRTVDTDLSPAEVDYLMKRFNIRQEDLRRYAETKENMLLDNNETLEQYAVEEIMNMRIHETPWYGNVKNKVTHGQVQINEQEKIIRLLEDLVDPRIGNQNPQVLENLSNDLSGLDPIHIQRYAEHAIIPAVTQQDYVNNYYILRQIFNEDAIIHPDSPQNLPIQNLNRNNSPWDFRGRYYDDVPLPADPNLITPPSVNHHGPDDPFESEDWQTIDKTGTYPVTVTDAEGRRVERRMVPVETVLPPLFAVEKAISHMEFRPRMNRDEQWEFNLPLEDSEILDMLTLDRGYSGELAFGEPRYNPFGNNALEAYKYWKDVGAGQLGRYGSFQERYKQIARILYPEITNENADLLAHRSISRDQTEAVLEQMEQWEDIDDPAFGEVWDEATAIQDHPTATLADEIPALRDLRDQINVSEIAPEFNLRQGIPKSEIPDIKRDIEHTLKVVNAFNEFMEGDYEIKKGKTIDWSMITKEKLGKIKKMLPRSKYQVPPAQLKYIDEAFEKLTENGRTEVPANEIASYIHSKHVFPIAVGRINVKHLQNTANDYPSIIGNPYYVGSGEIADHWHNFPESSKIREGESHENIVEAKVREQALKSKIQWNTTQLTSESTLKPKYDPQNQTTREEKTGLVSKVQYRMADKDQHFTTKALEGQPSEKVYQDVLDVGKTAMLDIIAKWYKKGVDKLTDKELKEGWKLLESIFNKDRMLGTGDFGSTENIWNIENTQRGSDIIDFTQKYNRIKRPNTETHEGYQEVNNLFREFFGKENDFALADRNETPYDREYMKSTGKETMDHHFIPTMEMIKTVVDKSVILKQFLRSAENHNKGIFSGKDNLWEDIKKHTLRKVEGENTPRTAEDLVAIKGPGEYEYYWGTRESVTPLSEEQVNWFVNSKDDAYWTKEREAGRWAIDKERTEQIRKKAYQGRINDIKNQVDIGDVETWGERKAEIDKLLKGGWESLTDVNAFGKEGEAITLMGTDVTDFYTDEYWSNPGKVNPDVVFYKKKRMANVGERTDGAQKEISYEEYKEAGIQAQKEEQNNKINFNTKTEGRYTGYALDKYKDDPDWVYEEGSITSDGVTMSTIDHFSMQDPSVIGHYRGYRDINGNLRIMELQSDPFQRDPKSGASQLSDWKKGEETLLKENIETRKRTIAGLVERVKEKSETLDGINKRIDNLSIEGVINERIKQIYDQDPGAIIVPRAMIDELGFAEAMAKDRKILPQYKYIKQYDQNEGDWFISPTSAGKGAINYDVAGVNEKYKMEGSTAEDMLVRIYKPSTYFGNQARGGDDINKFTFNSSIDGGKSGMEKRLMNVSPDGGGVIYEKIFDLTGITGNAIVKDADTGESRRLNSTQTATYVEGMIDAFKKEWKENPKEAEEKYGVTYRKRFKMRTPQNANDEHFGTTTEKGRMFDLVSPSEWNGTDVTSIEISRDDYLLGFVKSADNQSKFVDRDFENMLDIKRQEGKKEREEDAITKLEGRIKEKKERNVEKEEKLRELLKKGESEKGRNERREEWLQVLAKDDKWIDVQKNALMQDVLKKGGTKVWFPSGETSAIAQGHEFGSSSRPSWKQDIADLEHNIRESVAQHKSAKIEEEKAQQKIDDLEGLSNKLHQELYNKPQPVRKKLAERTSDYGATSLKDWEEELNYRGGWEDHPIIKEYKKHQKYKTLTSEELSNWSPMSLQEQLIEQDLLQEYLIAHLESDKAIERFEDQKYIAETALATAQNRERIYIDKMEGMLASVTPKYDKKGNLIGKQTIRHKYKRDAQGDIRYDAEGLPIKEGKAEPGAGMKGAGDYGAVHHFYDYILPKKMIKEFGRENVKRNVPDHHGYMWDEYDLSPTETQDYLKQIVYRGGGEHNNPVHSKAQIIMGEGKPRDQAYAIAYSMQERGELPKAQYGQEINYAKTDNTRTPFGLTFESEIDQLSSEEIDALTEEDALRYEKAKQEELARRKEIIQTSNENPLNQGFGVFNPEHHSRENWAKMAAGEKLRFFPDEYDNLYSGFDNWVNPFAMIGHMGDALGSAPLRAQQQDSYMPYATALGIPLGVGAVGGLIGGSKMSKLDFTESIVNPAYGLTPSAQTMWNKLSMPSRTNWKTGVSNMSTDDMVKYLKQEELDYFQTVMEDPRYLERLEKLSMKYKAPFKQHHQDYIDRLKSGEDYIKALDEADYMTNPGSSEGSAGRTTLDIDGDIQIQAQIRSDIMDWMQNNPGKDFHPPLIGQMLKDQLKDITPGTPQWTMEMNKGTIGELHAGNIPHLGEKPLRDLLEHEMGHFRTVGLKGDKNYNIPGQVLPDIHTYSGYVDEMQKMLADIPDQVSKLNALRYTPPAGTPPSQAQIGTGLSSKIDDELIDKFIARRQYFSDPTEMDAHLSVQFRKQLVESKILKDRFDQLTEAKLNTFLKRKMPHVQNQNIRDMAEHYFSDKLSVPKLRMDGQGNIEHFIKKYPFEPIIKDRRKFIKWFNEALPTIIPGAIGAGALSTPEKYKEGGELPKAQEGWFDNLPISKDWFRRRLRDSITPIGYNWKQAAKEFAGGKRLPFMWDEKPTSWDTFHELPRFKENQEWGKYIKNASMDAWHKYLGYPQKHDTFTESSYRPDDSSAEEKYWKLRNNEDIKEEIWHSGLMSPQHEMGTKIDLTDSGAGGFTLKDYNIRKGYDEDRRLSYIEYSDEFDFDIPVGNFTVPGEWIAGDPFNIYDRVYYKNNHIVNPADRISKEGYDPGLDWILTEKEANAYNVNYDDLEKGIKWVESQDGLLMKNPETTASGLYGQTFSEIKDKYKGSREDFIKDIDAQKKYFEDRYEGKLEGVPGLRDTGIDLWNEYHNDIVDFPYNSTEVAALSHFLGRQGTRDYFEKVLEDDLALEVVFPDRYGKDAPANMTPEGYMSKYRAGIKRDQDKKRSLSKTKDLIKKYNEGGELSTGGRKHLMNLGLIEAQAGMETGGYVVESGDNLWSIAQNNNLSIADIVELNKEKYPGLVTNPSLISPGDELTLTVEEDISPSMYDGYDSYSDAFREARKTLGKNKIFTYKGNEYHTNLSGEELNIEYKKPKAKLNKDIKEQMVQKDSVYSNRDIVSIDEAESPWKRWEEKKRDTQEFNNMNNVEKITQYEKKSTTGGVKDYLVQQGDVLSIIARDSGTTVETIMDINNIQDPSVIRPGQNLRIPSIQGEEYLVVDKTAGKMHRYIGDVILESFPILVGKADPNESEFTDAQTVTKPKDTNKDGRITEEDKDWAGRWVIDWDAGNKTTGAGIYTIDAKRPKSTQYKYNWDETGRGRDVPSFNLINENGLSISTAIHGIPRGSQRRKDALYSPTSTDNRQSNGCINGKCSDLTSLYDNPNIKHGTKVYILPDRKNENQFILEGGRLNFKPSKKQREGEIFAHTPEEAEELGVKEVGIDYYKDKKGRTQKGQGINRTVKSIAYKPIKIEIDKGGLQESGLSFNDITLQEEKEYNEVLSPS